MDLYYSSEGAACGKVSESENGNLNMRRCNEAENWPGWPSRLMLPRLTRYNWSHRNRGEVETCALFRLTTESGADVTPHVLDVILGLHQPSPRVC